MKPKIQITIITAMVLCITLLVATIATAQEIQVINIEAETLEYQNPDEPCVPPGFYETMNKEISANIARLSAEGNYIHSQRMVPPPQKFDWPLTNETSFLGNDYFFIQNYIDHDTATGSISDFMCGTRSYDLANGYDHRGTDICIGPYWWNMMDDMKVRVVAAAPGQILFRNDGNNDRSCGLGGNPVPQPNSITIVHEDGTRAVYLHMKNGSLTSKQVDDFVVAGEFLGYVGSSGQSTNPHLHFEVQDSNGVFKDPWQGPCNPDFLVSRWNNQKPYPNSGIMSILTMWATPIKPPCPGAETENLSNHFDQGASVRVEVHLRDLVPNTTCVTRVYKPNGNLLNVSNINIGNNFSAAGWGTFNVNLPNNTPVGTYRIQSQYQGKQAAHYFTVGCPGAYNLSGNISSYKGYVSGSSITSTQTINPSPNNDIWYEAVDFIQANVGFKASAGCHFRARIDACAENIARVETINQDDFTLQANPSVVMENTKLILELLESGPVSITVYDLTGRKVKTVTDQNMEEGTHEFELSVAEFNPGIYIISALSGESKAQCKIVVQK